MYMKKNHEFWFHNHGDLCEKHVFAGRQIFGSAGQNLPGGGRGVGRFGRQIYITHTAHSAQCMAAHATPFGMCAYKYMKMLHGNFCAELLSGS
jgi:hypothetical protein